MSPRSLAVAALALAPAAAFVPAASRAVLRTEVFRSVLEAEADAQPVQAEAVSVLNLEAAAASPVVLGAGSEFANLKASKFAPRARDAWDKDAGYSRYAGDEESQVYGILKASPLGTVDALAPFLEKTKARPRMLDGTHAGDCGFDPLGYAKDDELMYFYLESEVKHGRLAMVAAAGWVGAELAKNADHLASGGRAPSVLNGHLLDWQNAFPLLAIFGAWSYLEHQVYPAQYIEHTPNNGKHNYLHFMDGPYVAGNYEFDPFNLYRALGDDAGGRRAMRELEVQHGRAAMLGLTSWVLFEALTGVAVTNSFAAVFKPFWQWGLPFVGENAVLGTLEFGALCAGLGVYALNEVKSLDSIKYQGDGQEDYNPFQMPEQ